MALAEQAKLSELIGQRVTLDSLVSTRVASATVNPAGKLTSIIAGMAAGADSIDDLDVIRSGGMKRLFAQVYAPATLGQFLREFTHGHTSQLAAVARAHLVNLAERTDLLPGIEQQAYVDIDSLLRPVYGHAKQGASFGHTKIAGKQVLRKGLSPLATTISTRQAAPVVAGIRLRAGKAGSGRGADSMVTEAVKTARAAGATGKILVRGDSAYGTSPVVAACLRAGPATVLVGHSQGSVLSAWYARKLHLAGGPPLRGLITCGSPLSSLYARFFSATFTPQFFRDVAAGSGAWVNFWRGTDPIATAVPSARNVRMVDPRPPGAPARGHGDYWTDRTQSHIVGRLIDYDLADG